MFSALKDECGDGARHSLEALAEGMRMSDSGVERVYALGDTGEQGSASSVTVNRPDSAGSRIGICLPRRRRGVYVGGLGARRCGAGGELGSVRVLTLRSREKTLSQSKSAEMDADAGR